MLPQFYRFIVVNNSGATMTYNDGARINLKATAWIIDPATGKVTYTQLADDDLGFVADGSLADGAEIVGDIEIDNTTNKYLGLQVQLEITHDEGTAADGTFEVYISEGDATGELTTDAGAYSSAETGRLPVVGILKWHSDTIDDDVIRSPLMFVE